MNRIQKLSLVSAMTITSGFTATLVGTLDTGADISNGGVVIVANGDQVTNSGTATGLVNGVYTSADSEAIDVRVGGSLIGASTQTADTEPGVNTGGTVEGLVIRHHAQNWEETEENSGIYVPQTTHGFVSKSLTASSLQEMFDEGSPETVYRVVGDNAQIATGKTIFLTTESKNTIGGGELDLVTNNQLKPTQNVIFGSTVVINNSGDASGEIKGNLANQDFEKNNEAVAVPNGYTYATGLQLIGGTTADSKTLTLSGDNSNFVGPLTIGDGATAGVVYMGATSSGNPKNALGGVTDITVNNSAELNLRGTAGDNIETNGDWDFFGNAKLTTNKRIVIGSGHTVTFGKSINP